MFVSAEWDASTAAELLRSARERVGVSQSELAARAGVPRTMVSAYERDLRQPSLPTLRRLVGAAGFELRVRLVRHPGTDEILLAMDEQFADPRPTARDDEARRAAQARIRRAAAERSRGNKPHNHGTG